MPALDEFRTLAQLLRDGEPRETAPPPAPAEALSEPVRDVVELMRDARLFRARIAEAVDDAVAGVLARIAERVLFRELQMAPCDIEAVVRACLAEVVDRRDLQIFVHPDDARAVRSIPVEADPDLERGDCRLQFAYGEARSTLRLRLADAAGVYE